ncbi:MAG: ABC transporter permease [Bacteroidota bacterium]
MFQKIFRFEFKSRFTQGMTLLFILMMLFQGIWYTKGFYDFYGGDGMLMNAAGVFYQNLAGCGLLLVIVVAIITGPMLYKDIQYKSAGWVYSLPINDKKFFFGRFLTAFIINVVIAAFYVIGMFLVPYSGIGEAVLFGPTPFGQIIHGFFILTIPNLFLLTSICFAALAIFKKPSAGYLAVFLTVISFLLMQSAAEASGFSPVNLVGDAFGYVAVSQQVTMMSIPERNSGYLDLSGYLLINRLLWFSVSLIMLGIAYAQFEFKTFLNAGKKRTKMQEVVTDVAPSSLQLGVQEALPNSHSRSFDISAFLRKLGNLSLLEFKNVVRPVNFRIIAGILVLMAVLQNLIWNANYYIGPQVPTTSAMTNFRITNGVFLILLLMIWSGELFFKDKIVNIWQITDALPVPVWVIQLSKLIAMLGVAFLLNLIFMFSGIASQLIKGGASTLDMGLFLNDYLGYNWGWVNHSFYIVLTFFLAGLTGKRFLTHILGAGYFFFLLVCFEFGLMEELRFGFGITPGFEDYSEINGYGMWTGASFWYFLMWLSLGIAMVLMGILFWDRGLTQSVLKKLRLQSRQLNLGGKLAIPVFLIAFFLLQSFVYRQVNGEDNFELDAVSEAMAAEYERAYTYLTDLHHPKYSQVDMAIEFYPDERRATYSTNVEVTLDTRSQLDTLYLSLPEHTKIQQIIYKSQPIASMVLDTIHDVAKIPFSFPLDSTITLRIDMEKTFKGFSQGDPQAALVYRGSFASIDSYLPVIGFDRGKMLEENRSRAEHELSRLTSLLPSVEDQEALQEDAYRSDALLLKGSLKIGTSLDQTPIGTGNQLKSWEENNRRYTSFEIPKPLSLNWYVGTGLYTASENPPFSTLYFDSQHPYNVALYHRILSLGRGFLEQSLGDFPHEQVRLYEIPRYQEAVYAFPNGIAISEKEGWIADTTGLKERAYLHHTIATSLAQQWVQSKLQIAHVQGADMLRIALPEALALQFVQKQLGDEAVELLREQKMKIYNKDRFNDPNGEPPLLFADGKDYLEANLGSLQLYDWSAELGFSTFNEKVRALQTESTAHTFISFYEQLLIETAPKEQQKDWRKRFEEVQD